MWKYNQCKINENQQYIFHCKRIHAKNLESNVQLNPSNRRNIYIQISQSEKENLYTYCTGDSHGKYTA